MFLGQIQEPPKTASGWNAVLQNIATSYAQFQLTKQQLDAQKEIVRANIERAKAGLEPLPVDPRVYGATGPQVAVGITPEVRNLAIGAGIVGGALFLFSQFFGRRRR